MNTLASMKTTWSLFEPSSVILSPLANKELLQDLDIIPGLKMHKCGHWGIQDHLQWQQNDYNLSKQRGIVRSVFKSSGGLCFKITTDLSKKITNISLENE